MTTIDQPIIAPYRNAAEWLHDLGDIPLDRIIVNPWPGSATEADLLRKVEVEDTLCELVNGTLVEKPMGFVESMIASRLIQLLLNFADKHKLGVVTAPDGTLRLAKGLVRLPDVAFIAFASLPNRQLPNEPIPSLAPDLAVEVLSESNTQREMDRKLNEYFTAGTKLVWLIDPRTRSATAYTSPTNSRPIPSTGTLTGEAGVLEGFSLPLADLFEGIPTT